ncbi:MAG: S8 family serine peptidase [Pseudomonadota bacterium]|nr:S8 family serine peptidase [Pseudomonadota bacterium]
MIQTTSPSQPPAAGKRRRGRGRAAPLLCLALLLAVGNPRAVADAPEPAERDSARERETESRQERDSEIERDFERENDGHPDAVNRADKGRVFEPDQVLALELRQEAWVRIRALGFRILEQDTLASLGLHVTSLSTPGGMPVELALRRLHELDPDGVYDSNQRYGLASSNAGCAGIRCDAQRLVAWPAAGCARPVRLGMLDTAVSGSSPLLAGTRLHQKRFGDSHKPANAAEHGTAVATVLTGQAEAGVNGLLPQATLFAADVFNYGANATATTNAVLLVRGLDWLTAQLPAVINVSITGPDNAVLHEAIRHVTARGIAVVAAAGNLGPDGPAQFPAAYAEAIAVTAVDATGNASPDASLGAYVDVAAPGTHIWSAGADGRPRFYDGTSFAAPFVAAEAALRRLARPGLTPALLKAELHAPAAAGNVVRGSGVIPLLASQGCPEAAAR